MFEVDPDVDVHHHELLTLDGRPHRRSIVEFLLHLDLQVKVHQLTGVDVFTRATQRS